MVVLTVMVLHVCARAPGVRGCGGRNRMVRRVRVPSRRGAGQHLRLEVRVAVTQLPVLCRHNTKKPSSGTKTNPIIPLFSFSSPIGSSRGLVDVRREVSPTWFLVRQSQVIIVQIEPLERVHGNHDVTQRGVRPLHLEALVQMCRDGGLVVVIKLIQVLLRHSSLCV